jgi:TonB family protein
MNPLLYATSIGTFAAWLGVTGASTVGMMVPGKPQVLPELKSVEMPDIVMTDGDFMEVDMMSGGSAATSEVAEENNQEEEFAQEAITPEIQEITPDVPEVPEIAEVEPLPEIPELPDPKPQPKASENTFAIEKKKEPVARKPMTRKTDTARPGSNRPVARRTESGTGSGSGNANNSGSGAGEHGSGRISGGRTPRPSYPAAARKQGIEGTVRISITFGDSGEVISCSIVGASHPSLHDQSILSTIRRWKVPGRRGTAILPVRFTLR